MLKFLLSILIALLAIPSPALAGVWAIDQGKSSLTFSAIQVGALKVEGQIPSFSATLCFDEMALPGTKADLTFDLSRISTGIQDRDDILAAPDWLDTAEFPKARFRLTSFQRVGPNSYEAQGELEIKGMQKGITFPVYLDLVEEKALGEFTVDRRDFNIGEGAWGENEKWVGFEIGVSFEIFASQLGEACDD